jgi:hypothetical protein
MKMGQISVTQIDDGFARDHTLLAVFHVRNISGR